jgi:hypothetical protein
MVAGRAFDRLVERELKLNDYFQFCIKYFKIFVCEEDFIGGQGVASMTKTTQKKLHIVDGIGLIKTVFRNLQHGLPISESCGSIGPEKLFSNKLRIHSFCNFKLGTSNLGRRRLSICREFCTLELHSPACFSKFSVHERFLLCVFVYPRSTIPGESCGDVCITSFVRAGATTSS